MHPNLIFFSKDLMFGTRISATCQRLGIHFHSTFDLAVLKRLLDEQAEAMVLVVVDLDAAREQIIQIAELAQSVAVSIIAIAPHVDHALIEQALTLGVDEVFSRGKFTRDIQQIISQQLKLPD